MNCDVTREALQTCAKYHYTSTLIQEKFEEPTKNSLYNNYLHFVLGMTLYLNKFYLRILCTKFG